MGAQVRIEQSESLRYPEHLPPGSKVLYVCDGTDGLENNGIINGVKRTQLSMTAELQRQGYEVELLHPQKMVDGKRLFATAQVPGYEGFEFALNPLAAHSCIGRTQPDAIFIATLEGPLGMATAFACHNPLLLGKTEPIPYTVSFTTRLDQTLVDMIKHLTNALAQQSPAFAKPLIENISVDPRMFHPWQRAIYNGAQKILVPTMTMMNELADIGINIQEKGILWPRGVDTSVFHPPEKGEGNPYQQYDWYWKNKKPIALYLGRVAPEKNIESFLSQEMPEFHKVVIGDGPTRAELQEKYPRTHFLGKKFGDELASLVRWSNVHIFPSLTDTFGNTILETGASGVSTIGFTGVPGPQDIVQTGVNGLLIQDASEMRRAALAALQIDPQTCARYVTQQYSWGKATETLLYSLEKTSLGHPQQTSLR